MNRCGHRINHRGRKAFSLIEMLVVVTIILLLAALMAPIANQALVGARRLGSLSNLRQIGWGLSAYAAERGRYPDSPQFYGQAAPSVMVLAGKKGRPGPGAAAAYGTPPSARPLNPYLGFPDLPESAEVPVVHSPGDRGMESWYDRAGSSYGYANRHAREGQPMMIRPNGRGLTPGEIREPTRQLAAFEVGAWLMAAFGAERLSPRDYWYTKPGQNAFGVLLADGCARFIEIESGQLTASAYSFLSTAR